MLRFGNLWMLWWSSNLVPGVQLYQIGLDGLVVSYAKLLFFFIAMLNYVMISPHLFISQSKFISVLLWSFPAKQLYSLTLPIVAEYLLRFKRTLFIIPNDGFVLQQTQLISIIDQNVLGPMEHQKTQHKHEKNFILISSNFYQHSLTKNSTNWTKASTAIKTNLFCAVLIIIFLQLSVKIKFLHIYYY